MWSSCARPPAASGSKSSKFPIARNSADASVGIESTLIAILLLTIQIDRATNAHPCASGLIAEPRRTSNALSLLWRVLPALAHVLLGRCSAAVLSLLFCGLPFDSSRLADSVKKSAAD